jgi:hypothetical protein
MTTIPLGFSNSYHPYLLIQKGIGKKLNLLRKEKMLEKKNAS